MRLSSVYLYATWGNLGLGKQAEVPVKVIDSSGLAETIFFHDRPLQQMGETFTAAA